MTKEEIGLQPAFPLCASDVAKDEPNTMLYAGGMTYRQWLIGRASSNPGIVTNEGDDSGAIAYVDSLLARLEKELKELCEKEERE